MKTLITAAALLLCSGCANISQTRTERQGTNTTTVTFRAVTLFGNTALTKLDVDHKTDKTYGGLKIGTVENESNAEAIKAAGEAFGNAAAAAMKSAVKP